MQMRRYLWLMLLLSGAVLTACAGGSGSSGFDVRPENAAIQTALTEQRCVQHESLTICPAQETTAFPEISPTPSPAVMPTPTSAPTAATPSTPPPAAPTSTATASPTMSPAAGTPQVEILLDPSTPVNCMMVDQTGACGFTLPVSTRGFPINATFRIALRQSAPDSAWTIFPSLTSTGVNPSFDASVALVTASAAPGRVTVQAAVLVFLNPPTSVPSQVSELIDTGAAAAYVTNPFTLLRE